LEETLQTIRAMQGFGELQKMRNNSVTGGALGNVSNIEIDLLQKAWTSLNQEQTDEQLASNINELMDQYERVVFLIENGDELADMNPVAQRDFANAHLNMKKTDSLKQTSPQLYKDVVDGIRSGQISGKEVEEKLGFMLTIPEG